MVTVLKKIVDAYEVSPNKTLLALVDYNGSPNTRVYFGDKYTKEEFKSTAENIPDATSGQGSLSGALKKVREDVFVARRGERPFAEDILVVFMEGNLDESSPELKNEVSKLRAKPVKVIPVVIMDKGDTPDMVKIDGIASGINLPVTCEPTEEEEVGEKVPVIASQGWFTIYL